jgi:hypothetical protein
VKQIARPGDQVTVLSYPPTSNSILRKTNAAATKISGKPGNLSTSHPN